MSGVRAMIGWSRLCDWRGSGDETTTHATLESHESQRRRATSSPPAVSSIPVDDAANVMSEEHVHDVLPLSGMETNCTVLPPTEIDDCRSSSLRERAVDGDEFDANCSSPRSCDAVRDACMLLIASA